MTGDLFFARGDWFEIIMVLPQFGFATWFGQWGQWEPARI